MKKLLLLLLLVRNLLTPWAKKKERDAQPTIPRSSLSLSLLPSLTPQNKRHENAQQPKATRAVGPFPTPPTTLNQGPEGWIMDDKCTRTNQPTHTRTMKDAWMISELQPIHQRTNDGWMDGWMISEPEPIHQLTMKDGWMISEPEPIHQLTMKDGCRDDK
jgi:hypothetical protein